MPSCLESAFAEIKNALYWSMLAATTVGPGTVVVASKVGADFELDLLWVIYIASFVAFTLQEGAARLTIVSGLNLGESLRYKYMGDWGTPLICYAVALSVTIGNCFYEANNYAGIMAVIYSLPESTDALYVRFPSLFVIGFMAILLILIDLIDRVSVMFGVMTCVMVVLFAMVVAQLPTDGVDFLLGHVPGIPQESANDILALTGTTSLGFNLFLGSKLAEGRTISEMQKGVGFSTCAAALITMLVLIIGNGLESVDDDYDVGDLVDVVSGVTGSVGVWAFAVGFLFAAFSSILSVALGAVITIQSVLDPSMSKPNESRPSADAEGTLPTTLEDGHMPSTTQSGSQEGLSLNNSDSKADTDGQRPVAAVPLINVQEEKVQKKSLTVDEKLVLRWNSRGWRYRLAAVLILFLPMIPTMANVSAVVIIVMAQVVNGCILPFFATCLFLCLNDPNVMQAKRQTVWQNIRLFVALFVSWMLATNVLLSNILGSDVFSNENYQLLSSFCIAGVLLSILLWRTKINPFAPLREECCGSSYESLSD